VARKYSRQAIDDCWELFKKYNGGHFDLIETEMRAKGWVKWSRQNLISRGKDEQRKEGWPELYNWEEALRMHIASQPMAALNSAQVLVLEIDEVRKALMASLRTTPNAKQGGKAYSDLIYQHRDYCKLSIEALQKVEAARDTLGGFVSFWERLLEMLSRLGAEKAERELLKVSEQVIEEAAKIFGEEQDGLRPATDNAEVAPVVEGSGVN
jgi:hypothetical protein